MNILNKIHISYLTYLVVLISIFTGQFRIISFLFLIILIHEFGHIIVSQLFGWKIKKIDIYPFGGSIKYDVNLNEKMYKEFLVAIAGILFQFIFTLLFVNFNFLSASEKIYLKNMSYSLIIFNLLPIFPLDGSKIMFLFLNRIISYKRSHILLIYISFIVSFIISISLLYNLTFQSIIVFLVISVVNEIKNHNFLFNKFLLERLLNNKYTEGRVKLHRKVDVKYIFRERKNIFILNNRIYSEDNMLKKYFKKM